MEEDRGRKHRCKVCKKCFPNGRALGGHMRSHVVAGESEQKMEGDIGNSSVGGATASYALRKKPKKKAWELEAAAGNPPFSPEKKLCRECGKGFSSWKALFGHMRCHSGKSSRNQIVIADEKLGYNYSIDENEASWTTRKKKKKRKKKKTRLDWAAQVSSSSATSEIESERHRFAATTLLMLSKDKRPWVGFASTVDSLSSSSLAEEGLDDGVETAKEEEELLIKRIGKKSLGLKLETTEFDYDEREFKKQKTKKENREFHIPEASVGGFELQMSRSYVSDGDNESYIGIRKAHFKKKKEEQSGSKVVSPVIDQKSTYKCSICDRVFDSYQALGGHRAGNKRYPGGCRRSELGCPPSIGSEESMDQGSQEELDDQNVGYAGGGTSYKSKNAFTSKPLHQCLICGRVFLTGQALGGHKRSHGAESSTVGNGEEAEQKEADAVEIPVLLDLNLQAPAESDPKKSGAWWAGCGIDQEPLVAGII